MEKKQSSVEWLIEQMIKYELVPKGIHFDNILFHQAKAMHQEEVTEAFYIGRYEYNNFDSNSTEYYNITFGDDNEEVL